MGRIDNDIRAAIDAFIEGNKEINKMMMSSATIQEY
jgi:hypothetical protein